MSKVKVESNIILNPESIKIKDVVTLTVSNLNTAQATFLFNGVQRVLPPFDTVNNVPVGVFVVTAEGHSFDIDLQFTNASSNIIVDYAYLTDSDKEKC